ncbi:hypothetical protein [Methylobacterium oryzihabitans]|uniref:Uncharacterized protein n=1 Tax=Methylobacterium oryzihabitans TaxID=2499852 RepID=A0A3S2V5P9_9HYPH|nr:hypothetical protein [Methylobacterium oryzihabitans]RVU16186.1 hypothetical protein EOE48_17695 [Methylobacterium oryzihabitans]
MTPVARCLQRFDQASIRRDAPAVALVNAALDELEAAFDRPGARIVALEAVLHAARERPAPDAGTFGCVLTTMIDRRQTRLAQDGGRPRRPAAA